MLIGWTTFSLSFLMLGMVEHSVGLWAVSIFYGLCAGMSEGAERAIISDYAEPRERGTAFGWYHLDGGHCGDSSGIAVWFHLAISKCGRWRFSLLVDWLLLRRCCCGFGLGRSGN